ncbi:MAG TPA: PEP-CTERM sorting domain-containing protein [Pirellulales bacterium]|jgi:hypothetical protein
MFRNVLVSIVLALPPASAWGGIINGDFASGDFTGWTTLAQTNLGANAAIASIGGSYRAVLTSNPTGTKPATAAIQQGFSIPAAEQLTVNFGAELSLAGLSTGMAGLANISIVLSEIGGPFEQDWTYNLYNDPVHSSGSLSVPFQSVVSNLPHAGTYLWYAQVQAFDGPSGNDAFAQLTMGGMQLASVPEPATAALSVMGLGCAVTCWAARRRGKRCERRKSRASG